MKHFYFAYGSNMLPARLIERVPSARVMGPVWLRGYQLRFHKCGRDGSGKCDAFHSGDSTDLMHGVLYELMERDLPALDRAEGTGHGYRRTEARMSGPAGRRVDAFFYVATVIDRGLQPWHWYKAIVVAGAIDRKLPAFWVRRLRAEPSKPDPALHRDLRHRRMLR